MTSSARVLALSSSRVGNSGYLEKATPVIKDFLGEIPLRIAFIPFASVDEDYEAYLLMVKKGLSGLPYSISLAEPAHAALIIEQADVIMVGGGNTFKLLHDIYSYKLFDLIRSKVGAGVPYVGWSAGANIAGATIKTTNDMPIIEPESFTALGCFPFQVNPHYYNVKIEGQNGETRDQRLAEFMMANPGGSVVGLPEGSALLLENGVLGLRGEVGAVIFMMESGEIVKKDVRPNEDISFLISQ